MSRPGVASLGAAWFEPWLYDGPARLARAYAQAAPGPASADPEHWLGRVGTRDGATAAEMPALWRVGAGAIPTGYGMQPPEGFEVAVPLLDASHLQVVSTRDRRDLAEALVESLLLRVLHTYRPGLVHVHVWDDAQLAGSLPGLYPLTRSGLLTVHPPGKLAALLDAEGTRVAKIRTRVLADGRPSLAELGGERSEPWHVLVLLGDGTAPPDTQRLALQRLARAGLACGVQLITVDLPVELPAPTETIEITPSVGADPDMARVSITGQHVITYLDPPTPTERAADACAALANWHLDWMVREAEFADLLPPPERWWTESSAAGLRGPVGWDDTSVVEMCLDDASPHALIVGPSGSGKTNLLLAWIAGLVTRYSPDELQLYLLDYKEGVSFAQFAPDARRKDWLPHARLVGVNINTDREFGLALLQHLRAEMVRRANAAKAAGVSKLQQLREADPDGVWPRIVAVIDEFQYLFTPNDTVAKQAAMLLEDIARRGRSQGIHMVLASQDTGGIEAFWGKPGILEQFVLRVGLPQARKVMANLNDAAMGLPRWHALINHDSGVVHGNRIARIPNATAAGTVERVQAQLHARCPAAVPVVLDGDQPARLEKLRAAPSAAVVGQALVVDGRAAAVGMPAVPGRNLAVLGEGEAPTVLAAATVSLHGNLTEAAVRVACLTDDAARLAAWTAERTGGDVTDGDRLHALLSDVAEEIVRRNAEPSSKRLLLSMFGLDAADVLLDREGLDLLRRVIHHGPAVGVHLLAWWRSVGRMRAVLMVPAHQDDIGAWVACDAHGSDLSGLLGGQVLNWSPRPGRALLNDRMTAGQHVIMIPDLGLDEEDR